jgi:tight adherence protein B
MRERAAMKDEIETMTAEAKLSARVVASLPFIVAGAAWLIDSNFLTPLIRASVGPYVILGALSSVLAGYFILMKIADVNV